MSKAYLCSTLSGTPVVNPGLNVEVGKYFKHKARNCSASTKTFSKVSATLKPPAPDYFKETFLTYHQSCVKCLKVNLNNSQFDKKMN